LHFFELDGKLTDVKIDII